MKKVPEKEESLYAAFGRGGKSEMGRHQPPTSNRTILSSNNSTLSVTLSSSHTGKLSGACRSATLGRIAYEKEDKPRVEDQGGERWKPEKISGERVRAQKITAVWPGFF